MKSAYIDKNMSKDGIRWFFEAGVYVVTDVMKYVEMGKITKDEFHFITGYNYDGYKSSLEKQKNGECL